MLGDFLFEKENTHVRKTGVPLREQILCAEPPVRSFASPVECLARPDINGREQDRPIPALEELVIQGTNNPHAASPLARPCLSPSTEFPPLQIPPEMLREADRLHSPWPESSVVMRTGWSRGLDRAVLGHVEDPEVA